MKNLVLIVLTAGTLVFTGKVYAVPGQNVLNNENSESVYVPENKTGTKYTKGEEIYYRKCVACHQASGLGIPGAFPPLKASDFLKAASKKRLIDQVMNGSHEGLTVNGMAYSTPMPPQVDNAQEAVAVINYVLNAWGNDFGVATLQDAKGTKADKNKQPHMMMNKMGMMEGMSMNHEVSSVAHMTTKDSIVRKGIINVEALDKNKDGKLYEDVMDFNVISDKPGVCPICGMKLRETTIQQVKQNLKKHGFKYK